MYPKSFKKTQPRILDISTVSEKYRKNMFKNLSLKTMLFVSIVTQKTNKVNNKKQP